MDALTASRIDVLIALRVSERLKTGSLMKSPTLVHKCLHELLHPLHARLDTAYNAGLIIVTASLFIS
jgi:hypothetical protein